KLGAHSMRSYQVQTCQARQTKLEPHGSKWNRGGRPYSLRAFFCRPIERRCRLEMPKNGNATGILKSKLETYRCGSQGSRSRDCGKNVIVSHKRSGISRSWSRHVLNPLARCGVDDAEDRLARAVRRGHIKAIVARVVPDLIATAYLRDHLGATSIVRFYALLSSFRLSYPFLHCPSPVLSSLSSLHSTFSP